MRGTWQGSLAAAVVCFWLAMVLSRDSAGSCFIPGSCPTNCAACVPQLGSCTYSPGCGRSCDPGDLQIGSVTCGLFQHSPQCQHNAFVSTSQCSACRPGFFGPLCTPCPGPFCNGNGTCNDGINGDGACVCFSGAAGPACQYTRFTTCSGHGSPDATGACACDMGWDGLQCNHCAPNFYGPSCSTFCLAESTCNGRGTCGVNGQCVCALGLRGPHCETCDINYYQWPTCRYCLASTTCLGRGTCDPLSGQCVCVQGFTGPDCGSCGPATNCGPYICSGGACLTSCQGDQQCSAGHYCDQGQCRTKLTNGTACTADGQCGSGFCVDGVCCNSECREQCAACNVPGTVGTCAPAQGPPVGDRPACPGDGTACAGACNGTVTASCTFPDETTTCSAPTCAGGISTDGAHCDGAGACQTPARHACAPYACGASACLASCAGIDDCDRTGFCTGGLCEPDVAPPVVTVDLPPYTNHPLELRAQVQDNGRIDSVELVVNGTPVVPAPGFDPATGHVTASQLPLQEGPNTVLVRATDRAGNSGGTQVEVNLDTVPPALTFLAPSPGQAVGTPTVDATVRVDDQSPTVVELAGQALPVPAGGGAASAAVPLSGEGNQAITATARDAAGNVSTASLPILVDLSAPIVDVDVPSGSTFGPLPGNLLPLTVHVNDVAGTTLEVGGQSFALERGGGVVQTTVALHEGPNPLSLRVTSETGKTATLDVVVVYDTTPPLATMTVPADHSSVRGTIEASVEASDGPSGVSQVRFAVDGGPATPGTATDHLWTFALDTSQLPDGPHTLSATATDAVGNATTVHSDFVVDNTAPTVSLKQPAADAFVHGTIELEAAATDAGGVAGISLAVNGAPVGSCGAGPSCKVSYDTASRPDGRFVVTATAVDAAGNQSEPATAAATAVNGVPASFIARPTAGEVVKERLVVAVNVVDAFFQDVECFVDGATLGVSTNPNFTRTVDISRKLDGAVAVKCVLRDVAGNSVAQSVNAVIKKWTETFRPGTLNLKARGGTVSMRVEGRQVSLLLPTTGKALALVVPGGARVLLAHSGPSKTQDADHDHVPDVTLEFERSALRASIRAGIAAGAIDPKKPLAVHLFSGTRDLGSDSIRVKP